MFKKNTSVLTTRPLSGKDVKTLRRDVKISFPDLSEDDLDQLLPAKAEVQLLKLKNRATAYTSGSADPLFFDPEGRGDLLVPTVYALWRCPHMLDKLHTYSEVSPKVLGGADLFLQGLIVPPGGLGGFSAGDVRAVAIPQNPFPFAVGVMEVGSEDVAKTGLKGKGLKLLHVYGDQLWGLGAKGSPDPSFTPQRIFPLQGGSSIAADPAGAAANGMRALRVSEEAATEQQDEEEQQRDSFGPTAMAPAGTEDGPALNGAAGHGNDAAAGPGAGRAPPAAEDHDRIIEECLLGGLHSLEDSELPILTSDFYSKHMLPAKPEGVNVDVKKSSYKKLSKLLSTYEKKGLLSTKVVHKQDRLSAVNRAHELYASYAPAEREQPEEAAAAASGLEPAAAANPTSTSSRITVIYSYRVPSSLRPVFGGAADGDKDALFSEEAVRQALQGYVVREGLGTGARGTLKLDKLLVGGLFNKKEVQQEGDEHPLEDTARRLLSKLQLFHTVARTGEQGVVEVVKKGAVKKIAVSMEDRQGGRKHITRLVHVESFALNPDELGNLLQRKFKTSCSIAKLPGKVETGKEIALQGNLLQEIPRFLMSEYGIEAQYIDVKSKG